MGICPMNPEQQLINEKNRDLIEMMEVQLAQLRNYGFSNYLLNELGNIRSRYLYTTAILQDLQKMEQYSKVSVHKQSNQNMDLNLDQQLTNSCLILENEADLIESKNTGHSEEAIDSFHNNMRQNQSLVAQINIIYSKDIKRQQYLQSLKVFLKWGQIFQQHSYAGFLSPIYQHFCQFVCGLTQEDLSAIVDEICVFVQFMVTVVTEVYGLKRLAGSDGGKLIKNENVYNMIMSMIFKRTKIKKFLLSVIKVNDKNKIELFQRQIARFKNKPPQFFEISKKFTLCENANEGELNKSIQESSYIPPYSQSLKLVSELCKSGAPITKLKTIVNISKEITKDIERYYKSIDKQAAELDPDNLSAIVIYLLIKNGNKSIYQQLKIVQHFTTTNCLNCISGYYLNVFNASIQSILSLQEQ